MSKTDDNIKPTDLSRLEPFEKRENENEVFVWVGEDENDQENSIEIPCESDDKLLLNSVRSMFEGAINLKYSHGKAKAHRLCKTSLNSYGETVLEPPLGGWADRFYIVIKAPISKLPDSGSPDEFIPEKTREHKRKYPTETDRSPKRFPTSSSDGASPIASSSGKAHKSNDGIRRYAPYRTQHRQVESEDDDDYRSKQDVKQKKNENYVRRKKSRSRSRPVDQDPCDLLVMGLPYNTTSEQLAKELEKYGEIAMAEHKSDLESGKARGFGFVRFCDIDAQRKILADSQVMIGQRVCTVKVPYDKSRGVAEQITPDTSSARIFVGRVPQDATVEQLKKVFQDEAQYCAKPSNVIDVYIPRPFRGYAFVTFEDRSTAAELIKKRHFILGQTSLFVNPAQPKDETSPSTSKGTSSPHSLLRHTNETQQAHSSHSLIPSLFAAHIRPPSASAVLPLPVVIPGTKKGQADLLQGPPSKRVQHQQQQSSVGISATAAADLPCIPVESMDKLAIGKIAPHQLNAAWMAFLQQLQLNTPPSGEATPKKGSSQEKSDND